MVRVGLIGFGLAGQAFHAPVIRGVPGMDLACIVERRSSRAREKYPDVRVARTVEELLAVAHKLDVPAHAAPHLAAALRQAAAALGSSTRSQRRSPGAWAPSSRLTETT